MVYHCWDDNGQHDPVYALIDGKVCTGIFMKSLKIESNE